ncbi:MAG: 16S rRNA (guanine(966)-N(2))-methyltransferase RsmD [Alphaproteobacteria bacterium]|nr:16S rRNA (guanine(966)-N(2))-methyltransferase RsmD [Alphaproteobacteria bacterium]MBU1525988.1 16S rRNA (guanine(966)-N(2))-methyltransferase RsmD [Alphaproteobacteria bacterium]MBU2118223.1 16S rRNA (guanine(966)-N(2))-methyltransferase RsmD [Alphaproteobacteria bacterium]MBU2350396.1 16S rRNA (guanine(966)-N(2))-methyltransferase RsmD [Alphaproteobacteria bacterium]MBU2382502.1 16S rRNA (guanine(966)-N(2))-methyltransferase RsmD [Alphaproteobacteria bacterium]
MRIVAGSLKGRAITAPEGQGTRPTSDRARQAIFNILEHAPWAEGLDGARVIDLYAGSGALGYEALSRGASFALFVETDDAARGAIRENMDAYGLFGRSRVHRRSATDLGPRPGSAGEAFTLAFLDPPYRQGLGEQTLARLLEGGWLAPGALVVFERGVDEPEIETPGYERLDAREWGAARVLFLRLDPDAT